MSAFTGLYSKTLLVQYGFFLFKLFSRSCFTPSWGKWLSRLLQMRPPPLFTHSGPVCELPGLLTACWGCPDQSCCPSATLQFCGAISDRYENVTHTERTPTGREVPDSLRASVMSLAGTAPGKSCLLAKTSKGTSLSSSSSN